MRFGRAATGEARFRLVWSLSRLECVGGEWTDWDCGRVARRTWALRRVQRYAAEPACWLIERWTPAEAYGAPGDWPASRLGPYPAVGDYEDIGARMYWYPSARQLAAACGAWERTMDRRRRGVAHRVRERCAAAEAAERRRDQEFERAAMDIMDDAVPAFHGAPMAGSGEKRRPSLVTIAEGIGIRSHPY